MEDTSKYEPIQDEDDWVVEDASDYVARMQTTILPNFPEEVLVEWFHRHAQCLYTYAFLSYETLIFKKQYWELENIPGREAFQDEGFCDSFSSDFEDRVNCPNDWLAKYMDATGTWNTPIILLDNTMGNIVAPFDSKIAKPYHLLEGHRRLSFLVALRERGKALPKHYVWLARKDS